MEHKPITEPGIYNIEVYDPDFLDEAPDQIFQIMVFELSDLGLTYSPIPESGFIHPVDSLWEEYWYKQEKVRALEETEGKYILNRKRKRNIKPYYE